MSNKITVQECIQYLCDKMTEMNAFGAAEKLFQPIHFGRELWKPILTKLEYCEEVFFSEIYKCPTKLRPLIDKDGFLTRNGETRKIDKYVAHITSDEYNKGIEDDYNEELKKQAMLSFDKNISLPRDLIYLGDSVSKLIVDNYAAHVMEEEQINEIQYDCKLEIIRNNISSKHFDRLKNEGKLTYKKPSKPLNNDTDAALDKALKKINELDDKISIPEVIKYLESVELIKISKDSYSTSIFTLLAMIRNNELPLYDGYPSIFHINCIEFVKVKGFSESLKNPSGPQYFFSNNYKDISILSDEFVEYMNVFVCKEDLLRVIEYYI